MPLKGAQGRDFFIDNYVDHDSTAGIKDAFCGTKTYDGNKGADMILRSFKTMTAVCMCMQQQMALWLNCTMVSMTATNNG